MSSCITYDDLREIFLEACSLHNIDFNTLSPFDKLCALTLKITPIVTEILPSMHQQQSLLDLMRKVADRLSDDDCLNLTQLDFEIIVFVSMTINQIEQQEPPPLSGKHKRV